MSSLMNCLFDVKKGTYSVTVNGNCNESAFKTVCYQLDKNLGTNLSQIFNKGSSDLALTSYHNIGDNSVNITETCDQSSNISRKRSNPAVVDERPAKIQKISTLTYAESVSDGRFLPPTSNLPINMSTTIDCWQGLRKSIKSKGFCGFNVNTGIEAIDDFQAIVLVFDEQELKAMHQCLKIVDIFKDCSKKSVLWSLVSNEMKARKYKEWHSGKCNAFFYDFSIRLYEMVLKNSPNSLVASKVYPLYEMLTKMDLKCYLKEKRFKAISALSKRLESNKTENKIIEKQKFVWNSMKEKLEKVKYNCYRLSGREIQQFKSMIAIIDSLISQFRIFEEHMWPLVSKIMIEKGFKACNVSFCKNIMNYYICNLYKQSLQRFHDIESANQFYPLFEFIHSFDLSKYLESKDFKRLEKQKIRFELRAERLKH